MLAFDVVVFENDIGLIPIAHALHVVMSYFKHFHLVYPVFGIGV